jgi:hypothetical protein
MRSYFALQVSRVRAPCTSVHLALTIHPSIHSSLVSIGVFSCYSLYLTYLQNILHALVLSTAVGPLLHIFTVIFSLLSSCLRSCALRTHTYISYLGFLFMIEFPSRFYLCLVVLALGIYSLFTFTL